MESHHKVEEVTVETDRADIIIAFPASKEHMLLKHPIEKVVTYRFELVPYIYINLCVCVCVCLYLYVYCM